MKIARVFSMDLIAGSNGSHSEHSHGDSIDERNSLRRSTLANTRVHLSVLLYVHTDEKRV